MESVRHSYPSCQQSQNRATPILSRPTGSVFFAPAATPKDILAKLNAAAVKVLAAPDLNARFALQGAEIVANSPSEALKMVKADIVKWAEVAKKSGAKID